MAHIAGSFINAVEGDFVTETDTAKPEDRAKLAALVEDMTRRGYALFLEEGGETHRIVAYDAVVDAFEVRGTRPGAGHARITVRDPEMPVAAEKASEPSDQPRRGRPPRVTGVPPLRGG